jgi:hypothetical protein
MMGMSVENLARYLKFRFFLAFPHVRAFTAEILNGFGFRAEIRI